MMLKQEHRGSLRIGLIFLVTLLLITLAIVVFWPLGVLKPDMDVVAEWPTYRHNPQHTGMSPAQMKLKKPSVQWVIPLGVQTSLIQAYDLTGDTNNEVLSLEGGTLACRNINGDLYWRSENFVLRDIIGVFDLDLDGEKEVVLIGLPANIIILSASDGSLLWKTTLPDSAGALSYSNVRVGDISPSRRGFEMVTWVAYNNTGMAFTFEKGVQQAEVYLELNAKSEKGDPVSYPAISFVDIENDGILDITTPGWAQLYVFDGETGKQKRSVYWVTEGMNKRNYGHIAWTNIDEDPFPEAVVLASSVVKHFAVIDNDGESLTLLWDHFFEEVFSEDTIDIRQVMNSVTDLDKDGKAEIVVSLFNENESNTWHTLIIDPVLGISSPILDVENAFLWGVEDLDGNDIPEIMLSRETTRKPASLSDLAIYSNIEGQWQRVWDRPDARFIEQFHREFPDHVSSQSYYARRDIWANQIGSGKQLQFYYLVDQDRDGSPDDLVAWDLQNNQAIWSKSISEAGTAILDISKSGSKIIFTSLGSGNVGIIDAEGNLNNHFSAGAFGGVTPIVADLDLDNVPEVIIPTASGTIAAFNVIDDKPLMRWQVNGFGRSIYGLNRSVVAFDLNDDGMREVLVGQIQHDEPCLLALKSDGNIFWERCFSGFAAGSSSSGGIYEWTAGRWGKAGGKGVFAALNRGGLSAGEGFALDGLTGEIIWHQTKIDSYVFNPEGVVSVLDADENGIDELAIIAKNIVSILDGQTGETFKPFLTSTMDVAQYGFAGYGSPIVVDPNEDGNLKLLLGGNFGGNGLYDLDLWPIWWVDAEEFEVNGRMPGLGDIDGDGALEVAISFADGTLSVYDSNTGTLEWQLDLGTITTDIISADFDGDTYPEFLFGTQDGRLIVIKGNEESGGEVYWSMEMNFEINSPIVADADGDGKVEILVAASDGYLYAIR